MGTELSRVLTLESIMEWWMNLACRALEPAEREVVCGDLYEARENGWPALREVVGLVIRRRVLNLNLAQYCVPIGMLTISATFLLTLLAMRIADGSAIYLWMWINNSDWAILQTAGFWNTVLEFAPGLLFSYITLACCSWTCGLLIGWSSRRTRWLSALLLLATVVSIAVCGPPQTLGNIFVLQIARNYHGNAAVFLGIFYRSFFPRAIEFLFVILPAWRGMRQSSMIRHFVGPARFLLLLLCIGVLALLVGQNLVWSRLQLWGIWPLRYPHLPDVTPLTISVPITYLLLMIRHRFALRRAGTG